MIILETGVIIFFWKTISAIRSEMMEVLSDRQLKKLSDHKYKRDGDYTLLEPWLQPFWNWVVDKCPLWWAPNAITFIGLLINVFTALLIIWYNPDNKQETGVIIFIWKTISAIRSEKMEVLSDRQLKNIADHKYKREGHTILEPWLQIFWNWVVDKFPLWWAPNAITLIGLTVNVLTALPIILYNPDNMQETPMWAHVSAAIGVFIYQTLDAIDGKQARRTGSSSPLGELFDHGCDAVSTVVLVIAALIHCRLHLDYLMLLVGGAYLAFYLAHWVTYCTGALSFGKLDVVEIQFIMMLGFFISGIFGEDIWLSEIPVLGMPLNMVLVLTIVSFGALMAIPSFHTILIKGGVGRNGSTVADTSVIFPALPIFTVLALMFIIARKSELSAGIYTHHPCLYLCAFGFVFAKVTCKLIVAHMCKSEVEYWDSIYFGPALLFMNQYFDFFFSEYCVLWISMIYALINMTHYAHAVSTQICRHLGIYCFSIQKRPPVDSQTGTAAGLSSSRNKSLSPSSKGGVTTRQQAGGYKKVDSRKSK